MINIEKQYQAFVALRKFINEADDVVSSLPGRQDIKTAAIDLRNAARLILLQTLNEYEELREAYLDGKDPLTKDWRELEQFHFGETPLPQKASLYLTGVSALAYSFMKDTNATSFNVSSDLAPKDTDKKYKAEFTLKEAA